jgi:hypothetical protein
LGKSIYSKEQMEDFARFQDSQNTRRAYLAETAELAYLGRSGGEWGLGLTDLARDQIVNEVGYWLIPLYRLIGPTAVIVILVMFIVGMARILVDILVRAVIIARVRGWGFWMLGSLWDTAFEVAVSHFCWAVEKGKEGAGRIKNQMEARAAYAGVGHGGESPDNVEVLADWAASWRWKSTEWCRLKNSRWRQGQGQRRQELGERTFLQMGEALQPSTKSRSTVGRTQVRIGYSCSAAGECAVEAAFCYTAENSHHLEA